MAITQSAETILANLGTIPVMSGQVIYVRDAQQLYFDSLNGTRVQIRDVIFLDTDAQRTAIVAPLEKLYAPRDTDSRAGRNIMAAGLLALQVLKYFSLEI